MIKVQLGRTPSGMDEDTIAEIHEVVPEMVTLFMDASEEAHTSILISFLISILMMTPDPVHAWEMVKSDIDVTLARAIAVGDVGGSA